MSEKIVDAIMEDLVCRSGFGDVWNSCEEKRKQELRATLERKVQEVLDTHRLMGLLSYLS